jgi:hypothetical protein
VGRALSAVLGKDVTTKIYQDAGHAFLAYYRPSYREKPAFELWADITAYFGKPCNSRSRGEVTPTSRSGFWESVPVSRHASMPPDKLATLCCSPSIKAGAPPVRSR